jgi:hypothetical protein
MEERIKEMEKTNDAGAVASVDASDAKAATAPAPRKKNRVLHLLGNLAADIESDRSSLHYAVLSTDSLLRQGEEIRQFVKDPDGHALPPARINEDVRKLLERPNFLAHDATFSNLKSSGNIHLIKDVTLNWLLFSYYSKAENLHRIQEAEQQATIEVNAAYFLQWFAMDGSDDAPIFRNPGGIKALAANVQFRNQVESRVAKRKELQSLYTGMDAMAAKLQVLLRQ